MAAKYWVVQHIADVFRNEPRNVGVFVSWNNQSVARFFGEDSDQQIDGRKLKKLPYPDVYRQWVQYWRRNIGDISSVVRNTSEHYRVWEAGELSDLQGADISGVADHLFSVLVSEGAIGEALQDREAQESPSLYLESEVANAFGQMNLMAAQQPGAIGPHLIERQVPVQGRVISHTPTFSQRNGRLWVMETVDFTTTKKKLSRDHAGSVAYMFRDIRDQYQQNAVPVSLVRITDEDRLNPDVDYALRALTNEGEIVDWLVVEQRNAFLQTRREIANAV